MRQGIRRQSHAATTATLTAVDSGFGYDAALSEFMGYSINELEGCYHCICRRGRQKLYCRKELFLYYAKLRVYAVAAGLLWGRDRRLVAGGISDREFVVRLISFR